MCGKHIRSNSNLVLIITFGQNYLTLSPYHVVNPNYRVQIGLCALSQVTHAWGVWLNLRDIRVSLVASCYRPVCDILCKVALSSLHYKNTHKQNKSNKVFTDRSLAWKSVLLLLWRELYNAHLAVKVSFKVSTLLGSAVNCLHDLCPTAVWLTQVATVVVPRWVCDTDCMDSSVRPPDHASCQETGQGSER